MPEAEKKKLEKRAKKLGMSVSSYVLHCTRVEMDMISEDELCKIAKATMADFKAGKLKSIKSLKDLM